MVQFFVCFHNAINKNYYSEKNLKYITFFGVKNRIDDVDNIIYEDQLQIYNKNLQENVYNEGSCLYHVYVNKLYLKYNFIGFAQYDMRFDDDNMIDKIITEIHDNENIIFYIGFFDSHFKNAILVRNYNTFISGLESYNHFFKKDYTEDDLYKIKMPLCNTFLIPKKLYEKLMEWLMQYFVDESPKSFKNHTENYNFNPGHIIEELTGMFLGFQVYEDYRFVKMDISHLQK
jgi:hypothetical protein